jgi:poly(A) polymerase
MEILAIPPGRDVGAAYSFLLELRLDEGPMTDEHAEAALRTWWSDRSAT